MLRTNNTKIIPDVKDKDREHMDRKCENCIEGQDAYERVSDLYPELLHEPSQALCMTSKSFMH